MKISFLLILAILIIAGCTQSQESNVNVNQSVFLTNTPVANFTEEEINNLGVNCSGSDAEIAECIYDWQINNMIYAPTNPDKGPFNMPYPIKWVELRPDIYTSREVINNQVTSDGKIYGICWDFAVVYCSIARYYNLTCRVMELMENINNESRPGGMSPAEYEELKFWLDKRGFNYSYDVVRLSMPDEADTPGHYWAEVKLDEPSSFNHDGWRVMDASNKEFNGRVNTMSHVSEARVVNWVEKSRINLLNEFMSRELAGEDLSRVSAGGTISDARGIQADDIAAGRASDYEGITDDLGNAHRAANIDDYFQGKGLAPYFYSCSDVCSFFKGTIPNCESTCNSDSSLYSCYESCSGDKFYKVCDFICDNDLSNCYEACSGVNLNSDCASNCS